MMEHMELSAEIRRILDVYASHHLKKKSTYTDYLRELQALADFMQKDVLLADLEDCRRYMDHLHQLVVKGTYRTATTEKKYSYLFGIFQYIEENKIELDAPEGFWNCWKQVHKPVASRTVPPERILTPEELDRLIGVLKGESLRDYVIYLLIFTAGLSLQEICTLQWWQFVTDNQDHVGIEFQETQTLKRYVKLHPDMIELLNQYRESLTSPALEDHVFLNRSGAPLGPRWIQKKFAEICQNAEIHRKFTPRDLRHCYVVYALRGGAPEQLVADHAGILDVRYIRRYAGAIPMLEESPTDFLHIQLKKN